PRGRPLGDRAIIKTKLAARRPFRAAPGHVLTPLVALARCLAPPRLPGGGDRHRRGAALPLRTQAPRLGVGGRRLRARLPPLPGHAVARARRLPRGGARDAAAALGVLVPRRGP